MVLLSLSMLPCRGESVLAPAREASIKKQVDSVMSKLSPREKIAQLMIIEYCSSDHPKKKLIQNTLVKKEKIGGIIIMNDILIPATKRLNEFHKMATVPLLVTIDGEWGASMRYKEIPPFPRQMQLGALGSDSLVYKMGYAIGKECQDLNIHVNFAPDIDINNNPDNPAINTRSFGEDKDKVARYGTAYMQGMKEAGIYGSAKHFPGHGDTNVDSHKALPVLPFSLGRLDSLELYPFRYLIDKEVDMVMVGHLEVPALDPSGTPASISKPIITDFLRNTLGYKGIVITDALNMHGVSKVLEKKMIPLEAYKAGVDILLMPEDVENSISEIEKALKRGEITMASLNDRVRKVLTLKAQAGLFSRSYNPLVNLQTIKKKVIKDENKALITDLAKHSMTLVTNKPLRDSRDNEKALPVENIKDKKIAYVGYAAEKFGSDFATVLLRYAPVDTIILRSPVSMDTLVQVKEQLKGYDLIILGINNTDSRPQLNFGLDSVQIPFLTSWAAEQDMVAVYFGSPYALNKIQDYENFKALVIAYTNTLGNNYAAAQLVFGGIRAQGVLPVGAGAFKQGTGQTTEKKTRAELAVGLSGTSYKIENGMVIGEYIVNRQNDTIAYYTPIAMKEISPLLTTLPMLGKMIDRGAIRTTSFLGQIVDLPMHKHDKILISDLLMQRSGLPPVMGEVTEEQVMNLNINPARPLQFSEANLFYLNKILQTEYPPYQLQSAIEDLFASLGMYNTSVSGDGMEMNVITTLDDLSKFINMIMAGGEYGGIRYFSADTAGFLNLLITYYSINSDGFMIVRDSNANRVSFLYR